MASITDVRFIQDAIHAAVRQRTVEIIAEEEAQMIDAVKRRLGQEADRIALSILHQYNVEMRQTEIVITVVKAK